MRHTGFYYVKIEWCVYLQNYESRSNPKNIQKKKKYISINKVSYWISRQARVKTRRAVRTATTTLSRWGSSRESSVRIRNIQTKRRLWQVTGENGLVYTLVGDWEMRAGGCEWARVSGGQWQMAIKLNRDAGTWWRRDILICFQCMYNFDLWIVDTVMLLCYAYVARVKGQRVTYPVQTVKTLFKTLCDLGLKWTWFNWQSTVLSEFIQRGECYCLNIVRAGSAQRWKWTVSGQGQREQTAFPAPACLLRMCLTLSGVVHFLHTVQ